MTLLEKLGHTWRLPASAQTSSQQQFFIGSWLFIRALSVIYFFAFFSLSVQITGLVGSDGILPVKNYLTHAAQALGPNAWIKLPTLFWLDASDNSLLLACYLGMFFSILLFVGRFAFLSSISLFILYLSVFRAGQIFLNFQWDYLLLEAGFLTIFLSQGNNRLILFLFHWLLFRLRFLSGISKTGDPSWMNLSTLNYYFETQPLPHAGAWYFHQLPDWLLHTGTGFTLFIELIVPFFIFLPRRLRLFAAFSTIILQLLIIASSNHNWINLLTIALCLFLLDDKLMVAVTPKKLHKRLLNQPVKTNRNSLLIASIMATVLISTSIASALQMLTGGHIPLAFQYVRNYGLGNVYHVFPTMQTERYEFSIEGSHDGLNWQQYQFKYKPDNPLEIPAFIVPHQPRLDWMIWFVPSKSPDMQFWFDQFIWGLKKNKKPITALLEHNPFDKKAPRYIRVLTYRYHFTHFADRQQTGAYWKAEYMANFLLSRPEYLRFIP